MEDMQFLLGIKPDLIMNLLIFMWVFNSVRLIGNYAITNGIGTSNKSLGAIVMFAALLIGFRKYVSEKKE